MKISSVSSGVRLLLRSVTARHQASTMSQVVFQKAITLFDFKCIKNTLCIKLIVAVIEQTNLKRAKYTWASVYALRLEKATDTSTVVAPKVNKHLWFRAISSNLQNM